MKFSYNWLKEYIPKLPKPEMFREALSMRAFEVESIEKRSGDYILDIKPLNRVADTGGHMGMAHEIAAILNTVADRKTESSALAEFLKTRRLEPRRVLREILKNNKEAAKKLRGFGVVVEDYALCPRYMVARVDGVRMKGSPAWLKKHLEPLGINSINLLVDLANFIMFKTGQPTHVFDADKIKGNKIFVRQAKSEEYMTTLDEVECKLNNSMLIIADAAGPLAIAGVKGGNRAAVTNDTKNIIIESANFDGASVRKTAKTLKLATDAAQRFSQRLDPNIAEYAMGLLVRWILEYAGGKPKGFCDMYLKPQYPRKIAVRLEKIGSVLGEHISEAQFLDVMRRLDFKVSAVASPREIVVKLAQKLLGHPYYYGASVMYDAPNRFDCSSFVLYLFRQIGVEIPRMSFQQYFAGIPIADDDLAAGDLVFRSQKSPRPGIAGNRRTYGHVGIYIGNNKVIHAFSGRGAVVEETLSAFKKIAPYKGARRILGRENAIHFVVEVPTMRKDLMIEEDIIEEVGRIIGYDHIAPKPFAEAFPMPERNDAVIWRDKVRSLLVAAGFLETDSYNFIGSEDIKRFGGATSDYKELLNPTRPELAYLRRSAVSSLVQHIPRNYLGHSSVRFFEIGNVFLKEQIKRMSALQYDPGDMQKEMIAGAAWSDARNAFYLAKGAVSALFESAGIDDVWFDNKESAFPSYLHPYRSATIKVGDDAVGYIGSFHPAVQKLYDFKKGEAAVFEIDFAKFVDAAEAEIEYQAPSQYPAIVRDLAIIVPEETRVQEVEDLIENTAGPLLWKTDMFDLYEGEGIEIGKRSMAFHLVFQSYERTLRDEEVTISVAKIIKALESKGWEVRK